MTKEPGASLALIEHWNGSTWSLVNAPNPGFSNTLYSITALAQNTIWAAGVTRQKLKGSDVPFVLHWDGYTWKQIPTPLVGPDDHFIDTIAARSAHDIWIAGNYSRNNASYQTETLIEHWDGTNWHLISSPTPNGSDSTIQALSASSSTNVWGVGTFGASNANETFVEHWDGQSWQNVTSPNPGSPGPPSQE